MNFGRKIFLLSIVACIALADQTISTAETSTITSDGSENILIDTGGSITTDSDNDINVTGTLGSDYNITNKGTISNTNAIGSNYNRMNIYLENGNDGTVLNDTTGTMSAAGMYNIYTSDNNGYITNKGLIENTEENTSFATGIAVDNNYQTILNDTDGNITTNYISISVANNNYGSIHSIIQNNGSITSNYRGIYVSYNNGIINNNGNITSQDSAIFVYKNDSEGTITNDTNGYIDSVGNSIDINSNYGDVYNSGSLISQSKGIAIETNYGDIYNLSYNNGITSNDSSIYVTTNESDGSIFNRGKITSLYDYGIKVMQNKGYIESSENIYGVGGIFIQNNSSGATVNNSGNIYSNGIGMYVEENNGTFVNSNYIESNTTGIAASTNYGDIANYKDIVSVTGIYVETNNKNTINGGTIKADIGINVKYNNSDITNNGTIEANNNADNIGINVENNNVNGYVLNGTDGVINANIGINVENNIFYVFNKGSIDANTAGINVTTNKGVIINFSGGHISSSEDGSTGINVENNENNITNMGYISAKIGINVAANKQIILNDRDGEIYAYEDGSIGINVENNEYSITNNGYIQATSPYTIGINVENNDQDIINNGAIISDRNIGINVTTNNKTILNDNLGSISGSNANTYANTSINVQNNNDAIINQGHLNSTLTGIYVNTNAGTILNDYSGLMYYCNNAITVHNNLGTITNKGNISASSYGIYIDNDNNGTILNDTDANLSSSNNSITVHNNLGTITNNGNINASGYGIYTEMDNNGTILNNTIGNISANISMFINGSNNGAMINGVDASINTTSTSIHVQADNNGLIENNGTITSTGGNGIEAYGSNYGNILNYGNINIKYYGLFVSKENNVSIINYGSITSSDSRGIDIDGINNGTILNSENANITSNSSSIFVSTNLKNIINEGTLTSSTSYGMKVDENNATVINYGTIDGGFGGISVSNNNKDVINEGIISSATGINVENNYANVTNNNLITSDTGISITINKSMILNTSEGNITSKNDSIFVSDNKNIIINNGYLSGNNAINVTDNNAIVENNATIAQSSNGINITNNNNAVLNNGIIDSSNNTGINVINNNKDIINEGIISSATGINVENNYANVTNNNLITSDTGISVTTNKSTILNTSEGNISSNVSIYVADNENTITNNGYISSTDSGIKVTDNNATVENNALITGSGKGINVENNNKDVINEGIISSATGINVENNYANVTNNNFITSNTGISVTTNTGIVLNDTEGNITAQIGIYIGGSEAGAVINNGTITAEYTFQAPTATSGKFTNNGTVKGDIDAKGVDVINNGDLKLNPSNTVYSKTYIQNAQGILDLDVEVNNTTLSAQTPYIQTSGDITFKEGSTIKVYFVNTTDDTIGKWFNSLENFKNTIYKEFSNSEGLIAETTDGNISTDIYSLNFIDNSALLTFSAEINGTTMNLIVRKSEAGLEKLVNSTGDIYVIGTAKALDSIFNELKVDADIDKYLSVLDSRSSDEDKVNDLAEATPVNTLTTSVAALRMSNMINSIIGARQRGLNSGNKVFKDRNLWIKPYYTYTTQSNKDGYKGFSAHTHGFVLGIDGEYTDSKRLGLAFAYSKSDVNTNDLPQSSDLDGYTFIMYGSKPVVNYQSMLSYQIGIGVQKVNTSRYISAIGQTASGSYNAKLFYLQTVMNKNMQIKDQLTFIPKIKFAYKYYHTPSYSETGAGGLNLNVSGYNTEEMILGTGGLLSYKLNLSTDFEAYANIDYNFKNDRQTVSASFQGANDVVFDTDGIKNSAATFNGGMSMNKKFQNNTSFSFGFNIDRKTSGFTSRSVFAKYNMKF